MFKKVAYGIIAGSLLVVAQAASANDTQFLINGKWQGVSALPFSTSPAGVEAARGAAMPKVAQQVSATLITNFPAPYNMSGGYFN